ncbi:GNAT family N-acetyltransferase [Bosea rubneri]|uniref:GNAT family N-acetyltransferase n=1 Tax=Bosea rubneri TaxID=3075434 RepID=A0ABU3SFR4_9HYPH|nr:GNAT family N-acetyltransferase [Bosea sp. ZW T0_25]MDU0343638.1 GNAT family N-acetyltransferase [Bosea sp. ZW T0_25]
MASLIVLAVAASALKSSSLGAHRLRRVCNDGALSQRIRAGRSGVPKAAGAAVTGAHAEPVRLRNSAVDRFEGRALLLRAEQDLLASQTRSLRVVSGRYAVPFYQSLGFQLAGTEMTQFGPTARLIKTLRPGGAGLAESPLEQSR